MTNLYDETFHLGAEGSAQESAPLVIPLIVKHLGRMPESVLDVGCSTGRWLEAWHNAGIPWERLLGMDWQVPPDILRVPRTSYQDIDLRAALPSLLWHADLGICLEVGEHLAEKHSAKLVRFLTNACTAVFFGAAHPGQGGVDHINEQPIEFWIDLFAAEGMEPIDFRDELRANPRIAGHYRNNPILYVRR